MLGYTTSKLFSPNVLAASAASFSGAINTSPIFRWVKEILALRAPASKTGTFLSKRRIKSCGC